MGDSSVLISGITQLMRQLVELFGVIYTSGNMIFTWLATPLQTGAEEIIPIFAGVSPIELMFGTMLPVVLTYFFIKFALPF